MERATTKIYIVHSEAPRQAKTLRKNIELPNGQLRQQLGDIIAKSHSQEIGTAYYPMPSLTLLNVKKIHLIVIDQHLTAITLSASAKILDRSAQSIGYDWCH